MMINIKNDIHYNFDHYNFDLFLYFIFTFRGFEEYLCSIEFEIP